MSTEFGGLRKHEMIQHALVGLGGSAALAAAVALPGKSGPNFPKGVINKVYKIKLNKIKLN